MLGQPAIVDLGPRLREGERKRELRRHMADLAEIPSIDDLRDRNGEGMERRHVRLGEQHAGGVTGLKHPACVTRGDSQWLFAQNVLARLRRSFHPFEMVAVGEGDVHRFDIGIGQHIGVANWSRPSATRTENRIRAFVDRRDDGCVRDPRVRSEDPDSEWFTHR